MFTNCNSSLSTDNDKPVQFQLIQSPPLTFRYLYTKVRPSGLSLRIMWPFCAQKMASPGLHKHLHSTRDEVLTAVLFQNQGPVLFVTSWTWRRRRQNPLERRQVLAHYLHCTASPCGSRSSSYNSLLFHHSWQFFPPHSTLHQPCNLTGVVMAFTAIRAGRTQS